MSCCSGVRSPSKLKTLGTIPRVRSSPLTTEKFNVGKPNTVSRSNVTVSLGADGIGVLDPVGKTFSNPASATTLSTKPGYVFALIAVTKAGLFPNVFTAPYFCNVARRLGLNSFATLLFISSL